MKLRTKNRRLFPKARQEFSWDIDNKNRQFLNDKSEASTHVKWYFCFDRCIVLLFFSRYPFKKS